MLVYGDHILNPPPANLRNNLIGEETQKGQKYATG